MICPAHRRRRCIIAFSTLALGAAFTTLVQRSSHGEPAQPGRILDRDGTPLAVNRGTARYYPNGDRAAHILRGIDSAVPPGQDLVLTLDLDLQNAAHRAVSGHTTAAAAVVEVDTGRILALVSIPSFDPNAMTTSAAPAERERLKEDPRRPLLDRTLGQQYPPASTFKLVTAVAGLEHGAASPAEEMTCTGQRMVGKRVMRDMGVHGTIDFVEALQHSCNLYFWTVGERVGLNRLAEVARDFGFGAPTGLGINGDLPGQIPVDAHYRGHSDLERAMRLYAAIGAGDVKATVLQVAMAYAALANGGRLYAPQIVRRVQDASGKTIEEREPILRRQLAASPDTLATIRKGLWRAVNRRGGTAFAAKKGAVKMVGKTGTAELLGREAEEPHAWFAGWAPADNPKIAVVVFIENGGVGGAVAAPVVREIIDAYFARSVAKARRKAAKRKEAKGKEAMGKEAKRKEAKRKEAKRKEAKRKEAKRKEAKRKEAKRKEAKSREAKRQARRGAARRPAKASAGARRRAKRRTER